MADDRRDRPEPRPRRRRTDINPTAPTPRVPFERRRKKAIRVEPEHASAASDVAPVAPVAPVALDALDVPVEIPDLEPTTVAASSDSPTATPDDRAISEVQPAIASTAREPFHIPRLAAATTISPVREAPVEGRQSRLTHLDDRSMDPSICPFLRAVGDGELVAPIESPDPVNRCAALPEAVPQSLRQQELVCLTSGHVSCPRYLRGAAVVADVPPPVVTTSRTLSPAILGSLAVLVLAFSASVAFVLSRGGMDLIAAAPSPPVPSASAIAGASVAPEPSIVATPVPTTVPSTPDPGATPTLAPGPTPTIEPSSTPTPDATPRSDRYALLTACADVPACWIYRVRSGDNLYSIANYFGVSQDSIRDRNPWVRTTGLRAGQELRLPPPTR